MYLNHIASLRCHWNRLFMRNLNLGCPVLFCAIMAYFVLFLPYFGNFWAIFEPNSTSLVSKSMYLSLGIQWWYFHATFTSCFALFLLFCAIIGFFVLFLPYLGNFGAKVNILCVKNYVFESGNLVGILSSDFQELLCTILCYYGVFVLFSQNLGFFWAIFWVKVNNILSNFSKFPRSLGH